MKLPLTILPIRVAESGFYRGFSKDVSITSKLLVGGLILWAVAFPDNAAAVLGVVNAIILATFNYWYVYVAAFFLVLCFGLALWPMAGRLKLGLENDKPEFSNFSWFSMMFGAGIGIGMLTFATAEPMYHWASNPGTIMGEFEGSSAQSVREAYIWSFTHWGLAAWACYAIVGLSLAYFTYRRGLPLTIRSALTPLFGKALSGPLGHVIDVVAVVATVLGVSQPQSQPPRRGRRSPNQTCPTVATAAEASPPRDRDGATPWCSKSEILCPFCTAVLSSRHVSRGNFQP